MTISTRAYDQTPYAPELGSSLRIATWNLNNRIGHCRFRPEAAHAAMALNADVLVFTEFYPQQDECTFRRTLEDAGWRWQLKSVEPSVVANRVLMASRRPLQPLDLELPSFDEEFAPNMLAVSCSGLSILGVRIPCYKSGAVLSKAWNWMETAAANIGREPAVIAGDLNVSATRRSRAGNSLRRILANGWQRAAPADAPTFLGLRGVRAEIDHILVTPHCRACEPMCVVEAGGFIFAGRPNALSDHAAVLCHVQVP